MNMDTEKGETAKQAANAWLEAPKMTPAATRGRFLGYLWGSDYLPRGSPEKSRSKKMSPTDAGAPLHIFFAQPGFPPFGYDFSGSPAPILTNSGVLEGGSDQRRENE